MIFGQVITAMVTPMDVHEEIDWQATKELIHYLIANGSDGLVIAGTTGESATLSTEEKVNLFQFAVETVKGRVPVIAGTGSNNTKESIYLTKEAEKVGVDGIMLVTPYYNRPSQEGMFRHFQIIAQSTSLPIMLYNIPGRSAVNLTVETIVRLSAIPNIISIKEASGDLEAMAQIISRTPDHFVLYSGDDSLALPVLGIGGHGVVSVASHVIGNQIQTMINQFKAGNHSAASASHRNLLPIMKALFAAPNPTPVKAALNMMGLSSDTVRLPLVTLNEEELRDLQLALEPLGIDFHDQMSV